jgi:biopolymer transport protein ExbD
MDSMDVRAGFATVAMALAITACSNAESKACTPPRAYWRQPHNFVGLMPPLIKIAVTHNGDIYWNGQRVSEARLGEYLKLGHTLNPEPEFFLETEMGVSCGAIEKVRDQMDAALECKRPYSHCEEGIQSVWRDLPTPPGTPVS